jgi:hypothetical protein
MAATPLVPATINVVVQDITIAALGFAPGDYKKVRVDWQTFGQPFVTPQEDMVALRCVEVDDWYNRVREQHLELNDDNQSFTQTTEYTRVWEIFWSLYGPNSFDNARKLRSALFSDATHNAFKEANLYLITDPAAPVRVPEPFDNTEWWERVEFSAMFNEDVAEVDVINAVTSVEVIVEDSTGVLADITTKSK